MILAYGIIDFYRDMVAKTCLKRNAKERPLQVVNSGRTFQQTEIAEKHHWFVSACPSCQLLEKVHHQIRLPKFCRRDQPTQKRRTAPNDTTPVGARESQHNVEDSEGPGVPHLPFGQDNNHIHISKSKPRTMDRPEDVFNTARAAPFAHGVVRPCGPTTTSTRPR